MTDLVTNLNGGGDLQEMASKVAATLLTIAERETKVNGLAEKLGVSYKVAASSLQKVAAAEQAQLKAREKQQTDALRAMQKQKSEDKRAERERKKMLREFKEVATVVAGIVTAVGAVGIATAVFAHTAGAARANATAMAGAWTGGDGPRTIRLLDSLAQQLGEKFGTVREEFVKFRQAGLDNKMSAHLIKLRADLVAVGLSAEQADKEIEPVLSAKGDKQRNSYINQIAKAFHVAGDGATAASSAGERFDAALNRLDNAKTRALELVWQRIEPSIARATTAVGTFFGQFLASDDGRQAIESIGVAFEQVSDAINKTTEAAGRNQHTLGGAFSTAVGLASSVISGLIHPLDSLGETLELAGRGFIILTHIIDKSIDDAANYVVSYVSKFYDAGGELVSGLVRGITDKASSAFGAIKDVASGVSEKFKSALGIHSPSTVFAGYGENVVRGFEQGQQRALPNALPIDRAALAAPSGGSGGGSSSFTINVYASPGDDVSEWVEQIRREIQRVLTSGSLSRGFT